MLLLLLLLELEDEEELLLDEEDELDPFCFFPLAFVFIGGLAHGLRTAFFIAGGFLLFNFIYTALLAFI